MLHLWQRLCNSLTSLVVGSDNYCLFRVLVSLFISSVVGRDAFILRLLVIKSSYLLKTHAASRCFFGVQKLINPMLHESHAPPAQMAC